MSKPVPMPVAENAGYPSLAEATERAIERQSREAGEYGAYIACPTAGCKGELVTTRPAIMPTAFDGLQHLRCPDCGWTGTIPTGGGY